jgi:hypothetical protein
MEHFTVRKDEGQWLRWTIVHSSGLTAGGFQYKANAVGAARAMNAISATCDISTAEACAQRETMRALLAARHEWDERDRERRLAAA